MENSLKLQRKHDDAIKLLDDIIEIYKGKA
jgi:hypothetical protein